MNEACGLYFVEKGIKDLERIKKDLKTNINLTKDLKFKILP